LIWPVSKADDRQLYRKGFEVVFHLDISFCNEFISVVEIAQTDLGGLLRVAATMDHIPDDDIVGGDGDVDGERFLLAEFIVFYGIFHEGLERDRRDKEVLGGEVGYFDGHADGVCEADLQQVEIVADELYFFAEQDEVAFLVAEDIPVDPGEGIVIEAGTLRVTGDEKGQGVEGVEDEVRVDLVLEGFQFGLRLGDVELFDPGFVVFFFEVEEEDLIYIGDEAGGDDDDQDGVDKMLVLSRGFV